MDAHIFGVAQELSFVDGTTDNYVVFQLPNGKFIRASIDAAAAMEITTLFIQTGGAAAAQAMAEVETASTSHVVTPVAPPVAPHPALARAGAFDSEVPRAAPGRNYTPLSLDGDGNAEFGGDYQPGIDDGPTMEERNLADNELDAVATELQAASAIVSGALGSIDENDPAAVRKAVEALNLNMAKPPATLPQPKWTAQPAARAAPANGRQALTIGADAKGNPVFTGVNVADVRDLTGGNMDGQEPGEVGSI